MGALERQIERLNLLRKLYELTDGSVGIIPGEKDREAIEALSPIDHFEQVCKENYTDEIPYLAEKGYVTIKAMGYSPLYTITARTVDLIEKAELGHSLEEFLQDFDKAALETLQKSFHDDNQMGS